MGRSSIRGSAVLTLMCVKADLSPCLSVQVLRVVECPLLGYNSV
jgi:hypothetical protein